MAGIKSLVKETAVYGLSSIIGRFLNWCLVPLYTYMFAADEYGIVSFLYSFTAVALVILNYGMETGFFRYVNREKDPELVYTTSLCSVATTSLLFIILLALFISPVADAMKLADHHIYILILGITVAIDAFTNLPFAYLRYSKKAFRFAGIKLMNIGVNISLNLFFLLACPRIAQTCPQAISWFYEPLGGQSFGIGWIFVANLLSTLCVLAALTPQIAGRRWRMDFPLLRHMLNYSWPLLILGIAGILSQNMGQIIIPYLFPSQPEEANAMVGIYSANMKIAIIMVMFAQAFRYAYEPFIFARAKGQGEDQRQAYADAMKFFIAFGLFIFLGVMFFLPLLRHFISPAYWAGLDVVPVMMIAELCFGVFFNLSLWYKLTDRTQWGMYLSLLCFALMLGFNLWLVPLFGIPRGYMGSALAALGSYFIVMVISYILGRRYYPISYPIGCIVLYTVIAAVIWALGTLVDGLIPDWSLYTLRVLLLMAYAALLLRVELRKKRNVKA